MMQKNLDLTFSQWLDEVAKKSKIHREILPKKMGYIEIENRVNYYPSLNEELQERPFDLDRFACIIKDCWAMRSQADIIHLNLFLKNRKVAILPDEDYNAINRIDSFIRDAVELGFQTNSGSANWSGAATLASVILTSKYPERFVDFKPERWRTFSNKLKYSVSFPNDGSYGQRMIWAGRFASEIAKTNPFKKILFGH